MLSQQACLKVNVPDFLGCGLGPVINLFGCVLFEADSAATVRAKSMVEETTMDNRTDQDGFGKGSQLCMWHNFIVLCVLVRAVCHI